MAKQTRLISVVGKKNCGKTTLVVALGQEFARKGNDVATIKHGTHPATLDAKGTDSWRHQHEGSARRVLLDAPDTRVLFERGTEEADPVDLARRYLPDADIVIVEGYTRSDLPKIEVFRSEIHKQPHWRPDRENADAWVAMLTDDAHLRVPFPRFRFNDTAWLVALTAMAWDNALVIDT